MKRYSFFAAFILLSGLTLALVAAGGRVSALASGQSLIRAGANLQTSLSNGFTYQGFLQESSSPINDRCDMTFALFDAATAGSQIGATETETNVTVGEGRFTVTLNDASQFGSDAFAGDARWLEVAVRCPAGASGFTTLTPRQALTAAPYSLFSTSADWSGLVGVPAGFADGVDDASAGMPGHTVSVVATANGSPVAEPNVLIGIDGLPLLSYRDESNVWAAHCQDLACSAPADSTAVFSGKLEGVSMALGPEGFGFIAAGDESSGIRVRRCANVACTSFTSPPGLISLGAKVQETAAAIGIDGLPVIGFIDGSGEVGLLHCNDLDCATYSIQSGSINKAHSLSITIAEYGMAVLAYATDELAYRENIVALRCTDVECSSIITSMLLSCDVGGIGTPCAAPFITTDNSGSLRTGYVAQAGGGSGWVRSSDGMVLPVHGGTITYETALVVRGDGSSLLVFNYLGTEDQFGNPQFNGGLGVMYGPSDVPFDPHDYHVNLDDAVVDTEVAAVVGADGLPVIAYINSSDALAVVHCGNELCLPNWRR